MQQPRFEYLTADGHFVTVRHPPWAKVEVQRNPAAYRQVRQMVPCCQRPDHQGSERQPVPGKLVRGNHRMERGQALQGLFPLRLR